MGILTVDPIYTDEKSIDQTLRSLFEGNQAFHMKFGCKASVRYTENWGRGGHGISQ